MKKIQKGNKTFKIIPENKTVICEMDKRNIFHDIPRYIPRDVLSVLSWALSELYGENVFDDLPSTTVTAKATCDDHDKYDEERGIAVSASKTIKKQHYQLARKYDRAHMLLMEAANVARDKCMRHMEKVQAIDDDLVKYYGRKEG